MSYIPDATDSAEPTDGEKASTAALEFRTLKTYIQDVIVASIADKLSKSTGGDMGTGTVIGIPYTDEFNGIASGDRTHFLYQTTRVICHYGLAWKTLTDTQVWAFLSSYGGIKFVTGGAVTASLDIAGNLSSIGNVKSYPGGTTGAIDIVGGDGTHSGYMRFLNPDGSRKAYIGFGGIGSGNPIVLHTDDSSLWAFDTKVTAPNIGDKTVSTSAPSGGADGDVWYQV